VDMRFNLGSVGFRGFRNTIAHIEAGRYGAAADGMLASAWSKQVGHRAVELAAMMRTGEYVD
jgi:lysozyme